jgi:hypothetical protein
VRGFPQSCRFEFKLVSVRSWLQERGVVLTQDSYRTINLFNWTDGIVGRRRNPLRFTESALEAGENVDVADGALRTRPGTSLMSSRSLPAGEVMALENVRFPTNESSYLVAQLGEYAQGYQQQTTEGPPFSRSQYSVIWDAPRNRVLLFGGQDPGYLNDLWAFYPATRTWLELSPTGTPPTGRFGHTAIFDPVGNRMIVYGGHDGNHGDDACNDTFALTCDTLVWTQLADGPGARWWHSAIYRSANNSMIVCGGINRGPFDAINAFDYSVLDLTSGAWSTASTTGGPPDDPEYGDRDKKRYGIPLAYDASTDSMFLVGGECNGYPMWDHWRLSFAGNVWVERTAPPEQTQYGELGYYNRQLIITLSGVEFLIYNISANSWTSVTRENSTFFYYSKMCATNEGRIFWFTAAADHLGGPTALIVWSVHGITSVGVGEIGAYSLYASPDHLPTSSGVFTKIYEFGPTCGVCKFAVLNDRVVITEGLAAPPLVWAGAMADDASDWPHPKAVLIAQDGERFYDVSSEVCDKDPDTVAQVGGIRTWGAIYICTDMPEVEGFYFDMETPNTGATGTTSSTFHSPMQITEAMDVTRQDLKATIVNWVQSEGGTGHFVNGGAATVTLGPGNTNQDVIPGVIVKFADAELFIVNITGDGSGAASVTLSDTHANAVVSAIYGLDVGINGLSINAQTDAVSSTWSLALNSGTGAMAGYSIRQVIPASAISVSGDRIQLTLKSSYYGYAWLLGPFGFGATHVSIVEQDSEANGTTTPTEITFNNGQSGCTITAGNTEQTSDLIPFALDEAKNYIVIIDVGWATTLRTPGYSGGGSIPAINRGGFVGGVTGGAGYTAYIKEAGWGNEETSWNLQTVSGFTAQAGKVFAVDKIEVANLQAVPDDAYVAHTTDVTQLITSTFEAIDSVAVDVNEPGASVIYHAVSLDQRATFQVWVEVDTDVFAWKPIVREDSGAWQYNDSADDTPSWHNATVDSLLQALRQAFAVTENQMDTAALEAITAAQWAETGGFIPHITTSMDFAVGMQADGSNVPALSSYVVAYESGGRAIIEGFQNGAWTGVDGWTDNTIVNGSRLGQSGSILYVGPSPFKADYHVVDQVPGYWFRLLTNGTSPDCAITRIRYKAPCQPLANIGDGQPDTAMGFIYQDTSTSSIRDFTVEVSDNVLTELSKADIPMQPEDFLFVGYLTRFNEIEITPYADNNQEVSVLSAEYWNGETWVLLALIDGTIGSAGNTFAQKGRISWTLPTDWKTSIPFDASFSRGYWVRLCVSGALTSTAAISEVRIYGVPDALKKHKFAATFQNRIVLGNRPDAPDQVDISREDEEYGFTGQDSASYRVGGTDSIQCAISAWNGLLIGKTETWHQLKASSSGDFQFESVEAARHVPINSQFVVKAPVGGFDYGDRYGLFFVNRYGAFVSTGLHVDSLWNTSRGKTISDVLNWWDTTETPRLDLDYLHLTCGKYWPARNWIVWAVPMILSSDSGPQTFNNRLIVYDLTLGAWLPPFTISAASLCTAYHYNLNAPGKLGDLGLYAGDYQGRVIRLFGPGVTSDFGSTISAWAETGWLDFGSPEYRKLLRMLSIYGKTADDAITVNAFADGDTSASTVVEFHDLSNLGNKTFTLEQESHNVQGRFFKFRIAFNDASEVFGLQIATSLIRDWGAL